MADPGEFAANAGELKATARYFDQIQRASDRLGRTRYQNIVKLNNELKFTSRYFDQIYRTALKLSRLKLMPRVTLDDKASKDIDRLLAKLAQIRSKRIQVTADVIMPIQPAIPKLRPQKTPSIQPKVQPSVKPKIDPVPSSNIAASPSASAQAAASASASAAASSSASSASQQQQQSVNITITNPAVEMPELGSLEAAIASNTDAVLQLTGKLGTLSIGSASGGKEEKKDLFSVSKDIAGGFKSFADMRVDRQTVNTKRVERDKLDAEWLDKFITTGTSTPLEEREYKEKRKLLNREMTASRAGALVNGVSGIQGVYDGVKGLGDLISGDKESQTSVAETASNLIQETSNSGLLDNVAKGAVGKVLGPVATALQVGDVIRTTDDKERFEALGSATGSAIGGSAGAAIGSAVLPVIGTAVGGYLGSVAGDFVGGKVGGFLYDHGGKAKDFIDDKLDKLSDKLNNLFSWGKDKEKTESKSSAASVPALSEMINGTPAMNSPMYNPAAPKPTDFLDPGGRLADWKAKQEAFVAPRPEQPKPTNAGTQVSIEMSQSQLSTVTGTIQNAKPEVTNQISINIGPGTVQLDIHEEIDYAEIEGKIGAAIVAKVRQAFNNYKPAGGGGGSGGPSTAMAT